MLQKILDAAKEKGISQSALERAAGLPAARIAKWKGDSGEPGWSEVVRMCEVVGLHVCDLVDEPHPSQPPMTDAERAILLIVQTIGVDNALRRLTSLPVAREPQS